MKKREKRYEVHETDFPASILLDKEAPSYTSISSDQNTKDDAYFLINKSRNGVFMQQLQNLMNKYDLALKEIATILNISERTLQRYDANDILSKDVSDRALHLQRLYERGTEVFGTLENFKGWMKSPIFIFKNEKPISFLDTIFGFELIEKELGRIEHGIFA